MVRVVTVFAVLLTIAGGQTERWVYRDSGTKKGGGMANAVVAGGDGNVYAAGVSTGLLDDFTVISLAPSGAERWVYRYSGSWKSGGVANSVIEGPDGNIYAAGSSTDTAKILTVISLTPSGTERWVYRYHCGDVSWANSAAMDSEGNTYAAGARGGTNGGFIVVSVNPSGGGRWVYRDTGPGGSGVEALSVAAGADGNVYAAGLSTDSVTGVDFTVVSLTSGGALRWVYRYNGPANSSDVANTLIADADGNVYAGGTSTGTGLDFTVISLTSGGDERWVYRDSGLSNSSDGAYSLVRGGDGNIYAAGVSTGSGGFDDFTVISLTSGGAERWVYRYDGPGHYVDQASDVVAGADGNIYAAGPSDGSEGNYDFTVISLTSGGAERWVYRHDGPGNSDDFANSLVAGPDGNIYAVGTSTGSDSTNDFAVISLTSGSGIAEVGPLAGNTAFGLAVGTIENRALAYTLRLPKSAKVSLSLCDLQGRKLTSWQITAARGSSRHRRVLPELGSGVYFLTAEVQGEGLRENRKLIVAR